MSELQPLPIDKALQLYLILKPYFPDEEGEEAIDYLSALLNNMDDVAYRESVELMGGTWDEKGSITILNDFIDGLKANKIIALRAYCQELGL